MTKRITKNNPDQMKLFESPPGARVEHPVPMGSDRILITHAEAARRLRTNPKRVARWVKSGSWTASDLKVIALGDLSTLITSRHCGSLGKG